MVFSRFLNCANGTKSHNASYTEVLLKSWSLNVWHFVFLELVCDKFLTFGFDLKNHRYHLSTAIICLMNHYSAIYEKKQTYWNWFYRFI